MGGRRRLLVATEFGAEVWLSAQSSRRRSGARPGARDRPGRVLVLTAKEAGTLERKGPQNDEGFFWNHNDHKEETRGTFPLRAHALGASYPISPLCPGCSLC